MPVVSVSVGNLPIVGKIVESVPKLKPKRKSRELKKHYHSWSAKDYRNVITEWLNTGKFQNTTTAIGVPKKTAANIITQFKKLGKTCPCLRGGCHHVVYNEQKIANFLNEILTKPEYSNYTLLELQSAIWNNKHTLLSSTCLNPPSIQWIHNTLLKPISDGFPITLKFGKITPERRNSSIVIYERYEFVKWVQQLSSNDCKRLLFVDEHGFNL